MTLKKGETVSIVAMGPTLMDFLQDCEGDYRRPSDHVWAVNSAGSWLHDVDLIVAMDCPRRDLKTHRRYVERMMGRGLPVLTCEAYPEWPCTFAYPVEGVVDKIGRLPRVGSYLNNSANYALAYALYLEASEIRLYGCEFTARPRQIEPWEGMPDWAV